MSDQDTLPCVTFQVASSEELGKTHRATTRVKVVLVAEFADNELWDSVKSKLNGLKIYAAEDFKGEMLSALREDHLKLEQENAKLKAEKERLTAENLRMSGALGVLQRQIDG